MKKILFAVLAASALLLSSCEEKEPKIDISYNKALMDKYWVVTNVTQNPNVNEPANAWYDITNSQPPCVRDNRITFTTKANAVLDEHFMKCTESDPQTTDYGYVILNDNYIKIYTDGADIDLSTWRGGMFKLENISKFTIDERKSNPSTPEILVSTIYTYEKAPNE